MFSSPHTDSKIFVSSSSHLLPQDVVPPLAGAVTAVIVAGAVEAVVGAGAVGMVVVKVGAVTVLLINACITTKQAAANNPLQKRVNPRI
jgi:hypothetical protein